jgi:hypothetical protein
MHPIYFIGPVAVAYMAYAGFTGRPLWHIAIGALLMGTLNFTRAALAHVGPIKLRVISSSEALREGIDLMRVRLGGTASYAVMTSLGAAIPAGLIFGAGMLARRLFGS